MSDFGKRAGGCVLAFVGLVTVGLVVVAGVILVLIATGVISPD
jgi:hypothetical protein